MRHAGLRAFFCLALLTFASACAYSQAACQPQPPIQLFPGDLQPRETAPPGSPTKVGTPLGWRVAGESHHSSGGWWALVCNHGCSLYPTRLVVTPSPAGPDADEPGQWLHWAPLPFGLDHVVADDSRQPYLVALLKPSAPSTLKLAPGPVRSWLHAGMDVYPSAGRAGTMETRIPVPGTQPVLLVPRVRYFPDTDGRSPSPPLELELRVGSLRQILGAYAMGDDRGSVNGLDYLPWAGDLDGDGKVDLIVRFDADRSAISLWLSSLAGTYEPLDGPDDPACAWELVGEAGYSEGGSTDEH